MVRVRLVGVSVRFGVTLFVLELFTVFVDPGWVTSKDAPAVARVLNRLALLVLIPFRHWTVEVTYLLVALWATRIGQSTGTD
jgi:hypothetical protein